ncbi:MAG: type II toxin-antitoxin system RelE/ParE family toxin [Flavobacterium sp.]|nr:type II toxin-antitoxin system RelE/ParE family toxin [Flavobacterium sp.]
MARRIILSKRFTNKLAKLIAYLKIEWNKQVADEFSKELFSRIDTLSLQPFIGKPSNRKTNTRSILITKHNRMFYRVDGNLIKIVNMFDTLIHPKKILTDGNFN